MSCCLGANDEKPCCCLLPAAANVTALVCKLGPSVAAPADLANWSAAGLFPIALLPAFGTLPMAAGVVFGRSADMPSVLVITINISISVSW